MNQAGLAPIESSAIDRQDFLSSIDALDRRARMLRTPGDDDELVAVTSFVREVAELLQRAHRARRAEQELRVKICVDADAFFKTVTDRALKIDKQIDKIVTPYLQRQANEPQSE
jgi:hypothetical protein